MAVKGSGIRRPARGGMAFRSASRGQERAAGNRLNRPPPAGGKVI